MNNLLHKVLKDSGVYLFHLLFLILIVIPAYPQQDLLKFKKLTSNDGLSQNFISAIYQDKNGFMWFGTKDGLNRYDGYEFKVYRHNPFDSTSLSNNYILSLFEDSKGRLWVGSNTLDLFIPDSDNFKRIDINNLIIRKDRQLKINKINSILEDKHGLIWLGTNDGLISYNPKTEKANLYIQEQEADSPLSDNLILSLSTDDSLLIAGTQNGMKLLNLDSIKKNVLKFEKIKHQPAKELLTSKRSILSQFRTSNNIVFAGTPSGLVKVNLSTRESEFIPYTGHTFFPHWLNRILSIVKDKYGNMWFACSGGLVIYSPISNSFKYYFHNPKDDQSISLNNITSLYADRGGKIWIGTAGKGINLFDQNKKEFLLYDGLIDEEPYKSAFSVSSIVSESDNYLWIASQQKLFRLNRTSGEYRLINLLYGPEGEITSILKDSKQNIWVASSGGLHRITASGNITYYSHNPANPKSLKDNFVRLLFIDSNENLYALNSRYLSRFDEKSNSFTHHELTFTEITNNDMLIRCIYETEDGSLWFGWSEGLVKYNLETREKTIYRNRTGDNNSISNNEVLTICEDPSQPKKYLWIGTQGGGLSRLNLEDGTFANFSVSDGLPNNVVYGILSSGNDLWLSTNNGLCRVTTDKYGTPFFRNYDVSDGLQGNEFNTGAYTKSSSGELFFGGLNGVSAFFPSNIRDNIYVPPIVITELKFLNRNDNMSSFPNELSIAKSEKEMIIPYSQNSFSIQFASLDFTAPEKNKYKYKLYPINESWIDLGTQRTVTFTELGSGEYNLFVIGSNNDGTWNEEGALLKIIIKPPFWFSTWAYILYAVLIVLFFYFVRRYELSRMRLKNRLKLETFETQKLKELDSMKSGFFANISHEFRTPLTLILGPVEQLEANESDKTKKEKLNTIKTSANRLLRLINQILDLSKLETGKSKLNCEEGDLAKFLKGITMSFSSIAERKKIGLHYKSEVENIKTYLDKDVIEKIFYNLLSNAFKFTTQGGTIEVLVHKPVAENRKSQPINTCKISVRDSGIGIRESELSKVFNKFYTVENINGFTEQGSGIGLALVKELVELHKGNISVESKINEGSLFTVTIPIGKDFLTEDEITIGTTKGKLNSELKLTEYMPDELVEIENDNGTELAEQKEDPLIILIVEDNPELRKYIGTHLNKDYQIIEASTGKEGCERAVEFIPDLIISDVMMPEMDGYSLCRKLKTDERTSHIPIILLTARAGQEDKITGLETGADDYLMKPFNSRELVLRVKNLIEIRQTLRKKFSGSLIIKPKEIATGSIDKLFLEKAMKVVERNLSNDKFSVEDFSSEMNLSHSQLHRKLKALVNQSSIQFIRSIRMQRALELLKNNSGNIAEIAWQVGFTDPSYFTKIFSKHFGYLPSDVNK